MADPQQADDRSDLATVNLQLATEVCLFSWWAMPALQKLDQAQLKTLSGNLVRCLQDLLLGDEV